jgi:hypothetical protein
MEVPSHPIYRIPEQDAPLFDSDHGREIAAVVVGSDLLVNLVLEEPPGVDVRRRQVVARAMDGDGNQLGVLGRFHDAPAAQHNLHLVVAAAVRLFPNHLLSPLEDNRPGWAARLVRVRQLRDKDIARIDGKWRYVYGLYCPCEEAPDGFPRAAEVLEHMPPEQRLIHYIDDAASKLDDTRHGFVAMAEYDLVDIQVPSA